jgi:hypothetical protein
MVHTLRVVEAVTGGAFVGECGGNSSWANSMEGQHAWGWGVKCSTPSPSLMLVPDAVNLQERSKRVIKVHWRMAVRVLALS